MTSDFTWSKFEWNTKSEGISPKSSQIYCSLLLTYPLANVYITMENHHAIDGKKLTMSMAILNSHVKLLEGRRNGMSWRFFFLLRETFPNCQRVDHLKMPDLNKDPSLFHLQSTFHQWVEAAWSILCMINMYHIWYVSYMICIINDSYICMYTF